MINRAKITNDKISNVNINNIKNKTKEIKCKKRKKLKIKYKKRKNIKYQESKYTLEQIYQIIYDNIAFNYSSYEKLNNWINILINNYNQTYDNILENFNNEIKENYNKDLINKLNNTNIMDNLEITKLNIQGSKGQNALYL